MTHDDSIPGMEINHKYQEKNPAVPENPEEMKKEMEKTKKELDKLKATIIKKFPFTLSMSILPPQALKLFIEEEEIPKETEKHTHIYMIVPEEKLKEIPKIKEQIIKEIEKTKQKIWLQVKTPVDVWEICLDSKFDLLQAIAMSFPLHDNGFLGVLRLGEIHKSLVLQKFEKYVVSYVFSGSYLRGEAKETSDIDVSIIINDTDVKKMPRLELRERLRGIIYQYLGEAKALAGVKHDLHIQTWLLTDFWESVKDAHPVIFGFIRDGVPIYDRGTFMPWKALLKMGKLKPSPEALDMYMSIGERAMKRAQSMLLDIVVQDVFHGVSNPSQALLMLYGLPPTNVYETVKEMRKIFVEKEKMLEKKYADFLEEVMIKYYKGWEHGKVKEVSGKDVDRLLKGMEEYLKRLQELRKEIEKRAQERTIEQVYEDVFSMLKPLTRQKSQQAIIDAFEKDFVKKGKFPPRYIRIIKNIISAKTDFKKGKSDLHKIDEARKEAQDLITSLIEFTQRCELVSMEKGRMRIKYKEKDKQVIAELLHANGNTFLFQGQKVKKITDKLHDSNMKEVSEAVEQQRSKKDLEINKNVFEVLKKELGDFEIIL